MLLGFNPFSFGLRLLSGNAGLYFFCGDSKTLGLCLLGGSLLLLNACGL